jgi:hypothetical protein
VIEREINITLQFKMAIGEVSLNEIVFKLKEQRNPLMLQVLEKTLMNYDDLISERLSHTEIYPSKARKGLGRHIGKDDPQDRFCRGRKVRKRGYRKEPRKISTVFCALNLPIRTVACRRCGARYSPLLSALKIGPYARREMNFENEVMALESNSKEAKKENSGPLLGLANRGELSLWDALPTPLGRK